MRIVQIVHGFPPGAAGGTEIYTEALTRALTALGHHVLVIAREADVRRPEYAVRRERRNGFEVVFINNTFAACASYEDSYRNPALAALVSGLVSGFRADLAHAQHLTCLSTDLVFQLTGRGLPVVFTPNDYWTMCHRGQLLDREYRVCAGPGDGGCAACIGPAVAAPLVDSPAVRYVRRFARIAPGGRAITAAIARRLSFTDATRRRGRAVSLARANHMRRLLQEMSLVLAPSEQMKRRMIEFGVDAGHVVVHRQGIDAVPPSAREPAGGPLRVGFFGSLMVSKGAHVLIEALRQLPPASVVLRLFGNPAPYHDDPRDDSRLIALLRSPGVEHVGPIPHARVPDELQRLDVVAVPSIWPENAPFIIREALAARVPVVASRIGGIPELVADGVTGLLFEAGSAGDCARALRAVADDRTLLFRLKPHEAPRRIEDDARETVAHYHRVLSMPGRLGPRDRARLVAVVLNYHTPNETVLAVRSLQASDRAPDRIAVVDNDSPDGGAALRTRLPGVVVIALAGNRGYSGGINAGIRQALADGASHVLLVNSDVVVAPDTIALLEGALAGPDGAAVAGPLVVPRTDPGAIASLGMRFSRSSGRMRHFGFGQPRASVPPRIRVVDGVSGCLMLVRRDVFDRVGLFDESYFFGFEDLEFCLRARDAGFPTVCTTHAVAFHEGSVSIGARSPRRVYFAARNHLKLSAARGPHGVRSAARQTAVIAFNAAYVVGSRQVPLLPGLLALGRGVRHHFARRYGSD